MPLLVNLDELKESDVTLSGTLPAADLDLDTHDALIRPGNTLDYRVTVSQTEDDLVLRGRLSMEFACDCVRCLEPFTLPLTLENWLAHGELAGEDALPRVGEDVDLTRLARGMMSARGNHVVYSHLHTRRATRRSHRSRRRPSSATRRRRTRGPSSAYTSRPAAV